MLCEVGCQHVSIATGYAVDVGAVVLIGCQRDVTTIFIKTADMVKAVNTSVIRIGILTYQAHDKLFLTLHGGEGDLLQPVPNILAVSPPCLVDNLDCFLVHVYFIVLSP